MADFNHEEYQSKVTSVVVLFILDAIFGFCGNIVVLFIYGTRYPKNRFRLLVLGLSLVDLTGCCTTVPLETVSTYLYFDPPSVGVCKAKNFFVQLTGLCAMFMLFPTAIYKHRQICKPFKKQLSKKFIAVLCCSGMGVCLLCAIPAGILWDINSHNITHNNKTVVVRICEVDAMYHDSVIPLVYSCILSAHDIFLLATIVMYILVAKATLVHYRKMKRKSSTKKVLQILESIVLKRGGQVVYSNESKDNTDASEINTTDVSSEINTLDDVPPALQISFIENNDSSNSPIQPDYNNSKTNAKKSIPHSRHKPINIRKVLMMVIIVGMFSITLLIATVIFACAFGVRTLEEYASVDEFIVLFACYRLYFINYCLNPFVYFAFDRRFRMEIWKVLRLNDC